jgi:hypothetical protein
MSTIENSVRTIEHILSSAEARTVLSLRLLIARAANADSLAWWDDNALTPAADFVLARLFPMAPGLAGRTLALKAAFARHDAICPSGTLHLYRLDLDNRDKLALSAIPLEKASVPDEAIPSMDVLRDDLHALTQTPYVYTILNRRSNGTMHIEIEPAPAGVHPLVHRARTLAWAYLEGTREAPIFPYCLEDTA